MSSSSSDNQFSGTARTAIIVSLVIAIVMVIGVIVGARVVYDRAAHQPVTMTELPDTNGDDPRCATFLETLPDKVLGHPRATIADPVPAGAAAWKSNSSEQVTLRCGVHLPFQYTEYATPRDGWLKVTDETPGSTMATWYSVNTQPVVAVTADAPSLDGSDSPVGDIDLSALDASDNERFPAPLSQLAPAAQTKKQATTCRAVLSHLPGVIESGSDQPEDARRTYQRQPDPVRGGAGVEGSGAAEDTALWTAEGLEPIVVRCGVADPENYEPGVQLNQVNDIPWFEDTTLANGTTSSTWFALGRDVMIAVSVPQASGNAAVVSIGQTISDYTEQVAK